MWLKKRPGGGGGSGDGGGDDLDDEPVDWQLASPVTEHASPGTVFGVGPSGKPFFVGRLPVKVASIGSGLDTRHVRTSVGAYSRLVGVRRPSIDLGKTFNVTVEIPDAEAETVEDDELELQLDGLLEHLKGVYRADSRYFLMRASISAPSVVLRLGGTLPIEPLAARQTIAFPHKQQIAVLLDEIRPVKASLGGGPPQLGLMPVDDPPGWAEDVTVPWVTSIVAPADAARTKTFTIGTPVELTTSIGIEAGAGELAAVGISPEMLAGAVIQFKVLVDGAVARGPGQEGPGARSLVSPELRFAPEAPASFAFHLEAAAPGPVALRVVLHLNGRPTLRQDIALTAVEEAGAPNVAAALGQAVTAAAVSSTIDGRNLITLPAPRLVLELGSYDDGYPIELTVDGRRAERTAAPAIGRADLAHKTIDWRKRLVALSERYGRGGPDELVSDIPDALREFARIGVEIHQALFGRPRQRGLEDQRRMAETIAQIRGADARRPLVTIDAERLPLPWGVVYDRPLDDASPVDPQGFWGHRFLIERIAPAVLGKVPARSLRADGEPGAELVPCVNGHLDDQQQVVAAANQRKFFEELGDRGLTCRPLIESRDAFGNWLVADKGESRLVYFFCHASSAKTIDDRFFQTRETSEIGTWIDLDADDAHRIDIAWLMNARTAPLVGQPLIFLNACSTAEGDREFQSPFLTQFIREYDARGLIGSDWKMPTVFADVFARRFLGRFLAPGGSLGEAFVTTSDEFMAAGNPFPLIYAIYGRSDIVVSEERA